MNDIASLPYIVARNPMKYGGHQEDFEEKTQALIAWGARKIKEAPKKEEALVALFFELIEKFSMERQAIARDHKTPEAKKFGCRRDTEGDKDFYHTILDLEYKDYNPRILSVLADQMQGMALAIQSDQKKSKKVEEEYLGRLCSCEIEILEASDLAKYQWLKLVSMDEIPQGFPIELIKKERKMESGAMLTSNKRINKQ